MNATSTPTSSPRRPLSLPLAIVIASAVICGTILTIYLVERWRENKRLERATYAAWLERFDALSSPLASLLVDIKMLRPYPDSYDAAVFEMNKRVFEQRKIGMTKTIDHLNNVLSVLKENAPPVP